MNRVRTGISRLSLAVIVLICLSTLLLHCGQDTETEGSIKINELNARAVISPGLTGLIEGTTLVVPENPAGIPMVRSFPDYAGVEIIGQIGIGSALGFKGGERVILPVNINLGTQMLDSYTVRITLIDILSVEPVYITGSFINLAQSYPDQYDPSIGFEAEPTATLGAVITVSSASTGVQATGRINLFNLAVDIKQALPPFGLVLEFEIISLKDDAGTDLCTILDCQVIDGIAIENFVIR